MHFSLLLMSTVLLFSVVGLGLNIQFGYVGIVNFAGAAFFGIGSYTAATLATHTAVPHLLVLLIGGLMAALIGSLLIWPVLRTRGHYAALVTIAFGILFKSFLEVNDALGGPQGLRIPGLNLFGWKLNNGYEFGDVEISFYANYAVLSLLLVRAGFRAGAAHRTLLARSGDGHDPHRRSRRGHVRRRASRAARCSRSPAAIFWPAWPARSTG